MKKLLYTFLGSLVLLTYSCSDYLNVASPSNVDEDFVFSTSSEAFKVVSGCYDLMRTTRGAFFYDIDAVGSDAECHPEAYDAQTRHIPEGLYATEISIDYATSLNSWNNYYKIANRANLVMKAIAEKDEYLAAVKANQPNAWTQMYGEAATLRALCYFDLIRYFGDVPYFQKTIYTVDQVAGATCISRDSIYDSEIASLKSVEPLMYRIGEGGITAERLSRTYVQAFIGQMSLFAGGYGLRRTDFNYGNVAFEQLGSEKWDSKYVRRADYKKYYEQAKTYLEMCESNSGTAALITTDARGAGFNNPFQRNFQYNMDLTVSPESLFEMAETQASTGASERPYAFGRPSDGGSANAYPCKSYGQSRLYAAFYYGDYDPKDMRRDVTVAVTANSGACSEKIITFTPGSRSNGGLANNKLDESRMKSPYTTAQRKSGINWVYMRMPDVILMLSEIYAELGDEAKAKAELTKVRSRAFAAADQTAKVINYISALSGATLKEAIQQERKLEFAGEGIRRYDLIRTGLLPKKAKEIRDLQKAMIAGLKANGYYTFPNGNTIPDSIYVKAVNMSAFNITKMLTGQCEVAETDATYPVRFPGWRGNCDLWSSINTAFVTTTGTRNLAIQGLFRYIDPKSDEGKALKAAGYKTQAWGKTIVANEGQYSTAVFKGYTDDYYSAGVPPRYLFPMPSETIAKSNGLITNGYGFAQK